jgi:cysteine desulfurase
VPKSTHIKPKKQKKMYLDYASSASLQSANPGAIHELGLIEKNKLENARKNIAKVLDAHSYEIIFTSGSTESNNLAILGLVQNFNQKSNLPHIITTNIEHSSVLEVFKYLEKTKKAEVTFVAVEKSGIIDPRKIKKAIKENTVLVSVMYANNEIGTIQNIKEIAKEIRHFRKEKDKNFAFQGLHLFPFFHTDATQAINYLDINVERLGVDMMSFNSAKIYGPKGVGVLYVRKDTPVTRIMHGGDQEFGLRPGTENVELAEGIANALIETEKIKDKEVKRLNKLRDYFINKLLKVFPDVIINGDIQNRLPNNINISIPKIPSDLLVIELSAKGIMVSAKSACKAGDGKASHVIEAIRELKNKNSKEEIDGSLRFSLGRDTTKQDIDYTIKTLLKILEKLKKWYK